ncbi:MAG: flagellar basal-body rod protein FlgG, partial [Melioribacteraceae bacterium]
MSTRALTTAASGMYAQQVNIEVISNNIANINTTSFKKSRAEFQDLMYQEVAASPENLENPGVIESSNSTLQVGNGVILSSTQKLFEQGDLQQTGNTLDVAIYGEGFLQVRRNDGTFAYTRDGALKISSDGSLVTSGGHVLEPGFNIGQDALNISITTDGLVKVMEVGGETIELGNIELVKFVNSGGLKALGNNLYEETEASGAPILGTPGSNGFGEIQQGFLESS